MGFNRWFLLVRVFAVLSLLILAPTGEAARKKSRSSSVGGVRYVSLQKWSRAKGFKIDWDGDSRDFKVTNKWARIGLTINSKTASLNGMEIYLSSTIQSSGSTLFISERDISKLLHPILFPIKTRGKVHTIAIAAGHGGKDPGYQLKSKQEKNYTLIMAKELKERLADAGFKIVMTRVTDKFIELDEQADIANHAKADLFITIHYNAATDSSANGIETYCLTPEGASSTNGGSPVHHATGHRNDSLNML
jgi:N-acetylmuramoyl-L-alanine amidase